MSFYTDNEHEKGRLATLHWQVHPPETAAEFFLYGEYAFRLYEFRKAFAAYKHSADEEIGALFKLGWCFMHGYGTATDKRKAASCFGRLLKSASEKEARHRYYMGMCYLYGSDSLKDEEHIWYLFANCSEKIEAALYEQGLFFIDDRKSFAKDLPNAVFYLRKAYDMGEERAVFAMEDLFHLYKKDYPDHTELVQAYSWRLGRILRAAEKSPCREYYLRLSDCYRQGFPDDSPGNRKKFLRLADEYKRLAEILPIEDDAT